MRQEHRDMTAQCAKLGTTYLLKIALRVAAIMNNSCASCTLAHRQQELSSGGSFRTKQDLVGSLSARLHHSDMKPNRKLGQKCVNLKRQKENGALRRTRPLGLPRGR